MTLEQRDYQDRVVEQAIKYYDAGVRSILIESPTGSGKTVMALRILQHLETKHGLSTNWVAMRRNLLAQVSEANRRDFGLELLNPISQFDKHPPKADVIVVDEAQHDATASATHIHAASPDAFLIGLSATPFRTDKLGLCFERTIKDAGIHRLIEDGFLAKWHSFAIDRWDPATVAKAYLTDRERWGKSVVFFPRLAQAHEFSRLMSEADVRCEVVTGTSAREEQLAAYDRGEFTVLANVQVLTEGFDCPSLQTVFVRDSSKLPTIQMSGRALRLFAGQTHVNVVQSIETRWPFSMTSKPERAFVWKDERWLTLGDSEIAVKIFEETRQAMIVAPIVQLPDYIKNHNEITQARAERIRFQREARNETIIWEDEARVAAEEEAIMRAEASMD